MLEKIYGISRRGGSIKTEIIAGLATFLSVIYILPVNAALLSSAGMDYSGVFFATALVSFVCCLVMGLFANYPLVLSAGMGMNAYLTYTICGAMGFTWVEAMVMLTLNGIIFLIFSVTPLRLWIVKSIPKGLRSAISIGLGGFILFVGLQNAGIIVDGSTLVTLGDFGNPSVLLSCFGILLALGLMAFKPSKMVRNLAIPIALLVTAIVGVIASLSLNAAGRGDYALSSGLPIAPWMDPSVSWGLGHIENVVFYGFFASSGSTDPSSFGEMLGNMFSTPGTYVAIFTLLFVNMFDTTATLITTGKDTGLVLENGELDGKGCKKAMIADSMGALLAGPMGTSTVAPFAESTVGTSLGAKTGLSSTLVALCFLVSAFAYPIFSVFSYASVYSVALSSVGLLIVCSSLPSLAKEDRTTLFAGALMFITMMLTYSLSNGLGIGIIAYVVMRLFEGKWKEVGVAVYVIAALFLVSFGLSVL